MIFYVSIYTATDSPTTSSYFVPVSSLSPTLLPSQPTTQPIIKTTSASSGHHNVITTGTITIHQTEEKSSDSMQAFIVIFAISIAVLCTICCFVMFCIYYIKHKKSSNKDENVPFANAIKDNVNKHKQNLDNKDVNNNDGKRD